MKLRLLYFFLGCFSALPVSSQKIDEKHFVHYTRKDGLSNNSVTAITQDIYGYIWIATLKGLNRFDGVTFQQFYSDSSSNSLPEDNINRLRWLDKEQLAVLTLSGLHIINCRTLEQRNIIIPPDSLKTLLPVNRTIDALGDQKGNIFIATATGFYHFNSKGELVFRYDHFSRNYIEEKKITAFAINIIAPENNILLIATFNGPYLYDIDQKTFYAAGGKDPARYGTTGVPGKPVSFPHADNNSFSSIVIHDERLCWVDTRHKKKYEAKVPFQLSEKIDGGTSGRILKLNDTVFVINSNRNGFYTGRYHPEAGIFEVLPELYFKKFFCHSFLVDKNHNLWIATDQGLFREKKSAAVVEQITTAPSLTGEFYSIAVSSNRIFAGTIGEGLFVFDRHSLQQTHQLGFSKQRKDLPYTNFILDIIPVHTDTLFLAIPAVWVNSKNLATGTIPFPRVDSSNNTMDMLFKDSRNNIYLKEGEKNRFFLRNSINGSYTVLDYRSELSKIGHDISSMAEDPEGNTWFAGLGLMRLNSKTRKFDLLLDSFPSIKTPRKGISSNLVFNKSVIYFGVYASGLIMYDLAQKKFSQLTRSDGLPDNKILALYLHRDKLWIATENGLACYDLNSKKIISFGTTDGIPLYNGTRYSMFYDSVHQHLYGAFKNTIFRFNPDELTKNNIPPEFNIESIVIAGKKSIYHPVGAIRLTHWQNNLVLNLAAVNFEDADEQLFAYRLVAKGDEPWLPLGTQRSIIFSNLPAGNHRLQVKVYIRNQSWPEQVKEIVIFIAPPFWKTWWFIGLMALLLAGLAYILHRRRIRHVTQKATLDKLLVQTEMKALHAQMNPHFIFNCLNSIREMILNNENEQASLYLSKFARLIRITLNQSSKPFVTLTDTIDYLERYFEMEKIRSSHFTYTIEAEKNLEPDDILLPPMLIQPFIENAIWHGTSSKDNLEIHVSFRNKENQLVCVVEDNGIGIAASLKEKENIPQEPSVGIGNIKQRIALLNEKYNFRSTIKIEDKSQLNKSNGTGTIVIIYLPFVTNERLWNN